MTKTTFLNILRNKVKELGEDLNTLVIDGDLKNINQEIIDYGDDDYSNVHIKCIAFTTNYVYLDECRPNDTYQFINVIPRNPNLITSIKFEELKE